MGSLTDRISRRDKIQGSTPEFRRVGSRHLKPTRPTASRTHVEVWAQRHAEKDVGSSGRARHECPGRHAELVRSGHKGRAQAEPCPGSPSTTSVIRWCLAARPRALSATSPRAWGRNRAKPWTPRHPQAAPSRVERHPSAHRHDGVPVVQYGDRSRDSVMEIPCLR